MDLIVYIVIAALAVGLLTWFFRKRQVDYYVENQNSVLEKENQKLDVELNTRTNELALARTEILELKTINNRFQESITKLTAEKSIAATTAERVPPLEQELKGLRGTIIELESKNLQLQTRLEEQVTAFEEKIDIPEGRKDDFRREIMNYIGALAIDGKKFDYRTNERLHRALELKLFEDQKDSIKLTTMVSNVVDRETQEKIDIVKERMIRTYGYCDICATDVLNFVASIFARGDAKG